MFDRICRELRLGKLLEAPVRLSGGYTHRMFALTTDRGRYAVKLLNPEIMQRPDALDNYRAAEAFEALLEERGLPILPARRIDGRKMHCVDGQYLYVFDYFDGHALKDAETTPAHCRQMGAALARIHAVRPLAAPQQDDAAPIGATIWDELARALLSAPDAQAEGEALRAAAPMLTRVAAAMDAAVRALPPALALCHNDMDAKNVLWRGDRFRIIDLECLGYADPRQELLDLAISWAGWPADEANFKAFVAGYDAAGGARIADAALLFDSRRNHIDWLIYNARRALVDDPQERRTGRGQVLETIEKIESDQNMRSTILRWMEAVYHG